MRTLTTEHIILLVVLVGFPLLRAVAGWMRQRVSGVQGMPEASDPATDLDQHPQSEQPPSSVQLKPPPASSARPRPPRSAELPDGGVSPVVSVQTPRRPPPSARLPRRVVGLSLRQAWLAKVVLEPPPGLGPDSGDLV